MTDTPPPPGQYDELVGRLSRRSQTHNTGRAVGAGDGATHTMGYYDAYCAKDDGEAAAAITNLQQQVRDARGNALEEAAELAKGRHQHWSMPHPDDAKPGEVCDDISACADIATAILALKDKRT